MSQTISEKMSAHTVKVAGGSGVLIQPITEEYTYVFTAKHNLRDDKDDANSRLKTISEILIVDIERKPLKILEIIRDINIDIAIIIIAFYPNCTIQKYTNKLDLEDKVWLYGYPVTRRNTDNEISQYKLELQSDTNNEFVFSNNDIASGQEISGFSGGSLFYVNQLDDEAFLCGIETSMDGDVNLENHGRIKGIPICKFEELIKISKYNNKVLALLLPIHLKSFRYSLDSIFLLGDWFNKQKLDFLKNYLKQIANDKFIHINLTPNEILNEFSSYLKVNNREIQELHNKEMWSAFLELLVISFLLDKPKKIDLEFVKNMLKCRRFLYIASDDTWKEHVKEVLFSEHKDLKKNGVIVVRTHKASSEIGKSTKELKRVLENMYSAPNNEMDISRVNKNTSGTQRIVDLAAVHTQCIEKEKNYPNDSNKLETKIVQEYGIYLNNSGYKNNILSRILGKFKI